jgi:hypothetical protein
MEERMKRLLAVAVLVLLVNVTHGQTKLREVSTDDVTEKQGKIAALKALKGGRIKLTLAGESQEYVLDWKTMIYKLSKRNTQLFREEDKLEDVVDAANAFRMRKAEMAELDMASAKAAVAAKTIQNPTYGAQVAAKQRVDNATAELGHSQAAWAKEEEERLRVFGPLVQLVKGQNVRVYVGKHADVTYCVLVETMEAKK